MKLALIKTDFDIIKLKIESIKTKECLEYGNLINLEYINNEKKQFEYLENCYESLKNMIINLSKPYNFNLWRKIANIILKNIFIILRNNKFTIIQNKDDKVLTQLEKYFNNLKSEMNVKYKKNNKYKIVNELPIFQNIEKKLDKYKKELNSKTNTNINKNISQAADEESAYNLIVIYDKDKPDIIASLSIDFLFFLKEKSNQINHFDEKLLNFLSFGEKLQGKSKFNGKQLVEMLENPIKYQQKILIKTDNLFDLRNNKINEFRKDIKYDDEKLKEISKFEKRKN